MILGTLNSPVSGPKYFIVPYQQNPLIKGRTEFLKLLRDKLDEESPADKFNHRIALHGLGPRGCRENTMRTGIRLCKQREMPKNLLDFGCRSSLNAVGLSENCQASKAPWASSSKYNGESGSGLIMA